MRRLVAVCLLALVSSGCDLAKIYEDATTSTQLGVIQMAASSVDNGIVAPDTVTHDVAFSVTVTTYGNLCLRGADHTEVAYVASDTAVVRPFDDVTSGPCNGDALRVVPHTAAVTFSRVGSAVVRFEGMRNAPDGSLVPASVERTVIVR